jgi:protein FAM50
MGDFSRSFHRPDAGITTVEGNVSGARAMQLEKQRQAQQEEFEAEKRKRQSASANSTLGIHSKFQTARVGGTRQEQDFRAKTVGLVSASDFLTAAQTLDKNEEVEEAKAAQQRLSSEQAKLQEKKEKSKKKRKRKMASLLSFMGDEDEGNDATEDANDQSRKVCKKDPTVNTSFLPDRQRQIEREQRRQELEQEWIHHQETIRKEKLVVTFSFWDGSGHRRSCTIHKGASVGEFLEKVRQELCADFKVLKNVASDALLFVKEDLMIPHDLSFYDL